MSRKPSYSSQTIVDNLHTAILIIDENLRVLCINPAAEVMFHISRKRAATKKISQLILNDSEFFQRLQNALQSAHPYRVYNEVLTLHNHRQFEVNYSVSPLVQASHEKILLLEFVRLKFQKKLNQEENLLAQAQATKKLLSGLAHEIKNPLGGISGSAQLLERELSEKNKAFTQVIIKETQRLKKLVDRMVAPNTLPTKMRTNIHKVLEHVRHLVYAENNNINFSVDYDPSIPELFADESQLVQLILNLTRNAIIATQSLKNTQAKITYKTRTQRHYKIGLVTHPLVAKIDIIDNGAGVPPEIQETLFMPMITGHASGTGLGLSIAQSLAQQHEGLIEFSSQPEFTIFSLLLPIRLTTSHLSHGPLS